MIPTNDASGSPASGSKKIFIDAFIKNAHQILFAGYERLDAHAYQKSEEDEITGDLAREMNEVIGTSPEPWMRMFQVHDQHPVTDSGGPATSRRVGKRRSKIDLQFVANSGSGFHRFSWEAKRLGPKHPIRTFLGPTGLGCFISGQYSSECTFGGMIGYAQSPSLESWTGLLIQKLGTSVQNSVSFLFSKTQKEPTQSIHTRPNVSRKIKVYHTILRFF